MLHEKQGIKVNHIVLIDKTPQNNLKLLHRPVSPYRSAELMVLHMQTIPYERGILIEITVYLHPFFFYKPVSLFIIRKKAVVVT